MASTLTKLLIHVTFSTKGRVPSIPADARVDLFAYIGGICRNCGADLLAAGGPDDHVHLLLNLKKTARLADVIMHVKRDSSKWMKSVVPRFAWQDGYFAFSIGQSGVAALKSYIANQVRHHARFGFQEEVRELLRKYDVDFDERYAWD